jgi:signal transduction histidine kinase
MFESFVTTKTKGMGLGLLVTRSIVEGHGGRIWFTPNSGGGSTFTFTLPVAQEQQALHCEVRNKRETNSVAC